MPKPRHLEAAKAAGPRQRVAADWSLFTPYDIMRIQNCKTSSILRTETYPNIRPVVSKCKPEKTKKNLADAVEQAGCSRDIDVALEDPTKVRDSDVIKFWKQAASKEKEQLSYYGVGASVTNSQAAMYNEMLHKCLEKVNVKKPPLPKPPKPCCVMNQTPKKKAKCYVLNRPVLESKVTKMPTVQRELNANTALCWSFKREERDTERIFVEEPPKTPLAQGLDMERAAKEVKHGLRRKHKYCELQCNLVENPCTQYEWHKYKQDPKPYEDAFKAEQAAQEAAAKVPEPKNYDELYKSLVRCFEQNICSNPYCEDYSKCCKDIMKDDKTGQVDPLGNLDEHAPWFGGIADGGAGGKGAGKRGAGGPGGDGGAGDAGGRGGARGAHGGHGDYGGRGDQAGGPGGRDGKAGKGGKGGKRGKADDEGGCQGCGEFVPDFGDDDDDESDESEDLESRRSSKRKSKKDSVHKRRKRKRRARTPEPKPRKRKESSEEEEEVVVVEEEQEPEPELPPPRKPFSFDTDEEPEPKRKKRKRRKRKRKPKPKKEEKGDCPCPCEVCEFMNRRLNETDAPFLKDMLEEQKRRELKDYLKRMCHREYIKTRPTPYPAPQHRCDKIDCNDCFCRNPELSDCIERLGAMQELRDELGRKSHMVERQVLFELDSLKQQLCRRFCDCFG